MSDVLESFKMSRWIVINFTAMAEQPRCHQTFNWGRKLWALFSVRPNKQICLFKKKLSVLEKKTTKNTTTMEILGTFGVREKNYKVGLRGQSMCLSWVIIIVQAFFLYKIICENIFSLLIENLVQYLNFAV